MWAGFNTEAGDETRFQAAAERGCKRKSFKKNHPGLV